MKRKKPKDNKAVGYIRVSDPKQVKGGMSLEYQEEKIKKHCDLHELDLVELVIDAGHSAYKGDLRKRERGPRVFELVESGEVSQVVAVRLDRLFRSQLDCLRTVVGWDQRGVALHLIDFGGYALDTSTVMGRLVIVSMASMAELESQAKSERMCEVWAHVKKQGRILGKNPPFGYSVGNGNQLTENKDEQDTITLITKWRSQGRSYREIVDKLTQEGRKPRGSKWNLTTVVRIVKKNGI